LQEALQEEHQRLNREGLHGQHLQALLARQVSFPSSSPEPDLQPHSGHSTHDPNMLRDSAVGRLVSQIQVPSEEEQVARALCTRLVDYIAYQAAADELEGSIVDELEQYQATCFQHRYMPHASTSRPHSSHGPEDAYSRRPRSQRSSPMRHRSSPGATSARFANVERLMTNKSRHETSQPEHVPGPAKARVLSAPTSKQHHASQARDPGMHRAGDKSHGKPPPSQQSPQRRRATMTDMPSYRRPAEDSGRPVEQHSDHFGQSSSFQHHGDPPSLQVAQRPLRPLWLLPPRLSSGSLWAYMQKCGSRWHDSPCLCALSEWASAVPARSKGAASAGTVVVLSSYLQKRVAEMCREQLDTIKVEAKDTQRHLSKRSLAATAAANQAALMAT